MANPASKNSDLNATEPPPSDRVLAARCLAGEQLAMRELVERHQSMVLGLCIRMLCHRQDAEDVVQETFVRALKSLERWDPERRFEPWLLTIAANRCRTALAKRRAATLDQRSLADELPARADHQPALGQLAEEVELALAEIRDDYRQAFELFHTDELAYAEIAEVLDVPLGTVKTWVHRARQEVADRLRRRGVVESPKSSEPQQQANENSDAMSRFRNAAARVAG